MKLLIVCNPRSGKGKIKNNLDYIKSRLKTKYDVFTFEVKENESIIEHIKNDNNRYDIFLILGGDGTVNKVVSGVCELPYKPKLAIIPFGTVNDMAKNLKMSKNLDKSLDIILNSNNIYSHKIYKVNNDYFDYALAYGVCTGVSFIEKKRFGALSYYMEAVRLFFTDKAHDISVIINNEEIKGKFQLFFATNSSHIAGYKIKQKDSISIAMFKGFRLFILIELLFYMLTGVTKYRYETDEFILKTKPGVFNGDGESFNHDGIIKVKYAKTLEFICK